ncbi:MAG: carboxypeptidase-like regulatory domain-containing protein [Bacteroidota bacterium]
MKGWKIVLLFLLLLTPFSFTQAQSNKTGFSIRAQIVDGQDATPLPYASIFNQNQKRGTASDLEGYFTMPYNQQGDTLLISYIGYKSRKYVLQNNRIDTIQLLSSTTTLDEVVITTDNDYLYDLILEARKNGGKVNRQAKSYFFLETQLDGQTSEFIEAYYNGSFNGYKTHSLGLKKGRIGLRPIHQNYFLTTESSQVFLLQNLFTKDGFFPWNPLCMKKGKLRKAYGLSLKNILFEKGDRIYQIEATPKDSTAGYFTTTLWINLTDKQILKVNLQADQCRQHPFAMIGETDPTSLPVNLNISHQYKEIEGGMTLDAIDFQYELTYKNEENQDVTVGTRAYLKAYGEGRPFHLPMFQFSNSLHKDYRDFTAAPYDSVFWTEVDEFRLFDKAKEVDGFMKKHKVEDNFYAFNHDEEFQLSYGYVSWRPDRIAIKELTQEDIDKRVSERAIDADRYQLGVKLYLDASRVNDSLIYQAHVIMDPMETFYYFEMDPLDHAFINMYFDLMEIAKRRMEQEMKLLPYLTLKDTERLYASAQRNFAIHANKFVKEVQRGGNEKKLREWNDYIYERLGIDNMGIYGLYPMGPTKKTSQKGGR